MTRYILDPHNKPRSVAVGYDGMTDEFYGYAFGHQEARPILADRRESAVDGVLAASRVIDAVRPWADSIPPGLAHTLHSSRTLAAPAPGAALRAVLISDDGKISDRAHPVSNGDTLTILRTQVQGHIDVVRLGHGLDAWLDDEGMFRKMPNMYGTRVLWELGAARQLYFGPILLTGADGPDTVSLTELHAARLRNIYDAVRPPWTVYGVGDVIEIRSEGGATYRAEVIAQYANVRPGRPGFNAVTPIGRVIVGYDRQIIRVIKRKSN